MSNDNRAVAKILRVLVHEFGNRLSPATMLMEALLYEAEGETLEDLRDSVDSINAVVELSSALREFSQILEEDMPDGVMLHAKFLEVIATRLRGSETISLLKQGLSVAHPPAEAGDTP